MASHGHPFRQADRAGAADKRPERCSMGAGRDVVVTGCGVVSALADTAPGTGTEQNDRAEVLALKSVLGERARSIPVVSIKGMVGHCLGAVGAIEAFAAVMALHHGVMPPTAGLSAPDPELDLDFVPGAVRAADLRVVVSNSSAFGGNNGSLVFRRHET